MNEDGNVNMKRSILMSNQRTTGTARHKILPRRIAASLAAILASCAHGHDIGPWGAKLLAWQSEQVSRVIGGGSAIFTQPRMREIEGRKCVSGSSLNFDVRDAYAFDIDEPVQLDIEFYTQAVGKKVALTYDRSDVAPAFNGFGDAASTKDLELPPASATYWHREKIALERARFANTGFSGTDFSLRAASLYEIDASGRRLPATAHEFVVCGVRLTRSNTTPLPNVFGAVVIRVLDEKGRLAPARMGLYDRGGRLPLPSEAALRIRSFNNTSRIVALRDGAAPWPVKNRSVFYVDGAYRSKLPVGDYEVIVAKGPEYRIARKRFTVKAGTTREMSIQLRRWTHMAGKGWYSGDDHIHYARDSTQDDHNLLRFTEAEDLNLGNILQMGNSGNFYFRQHAWKPIANTEKTHFILVPGQEDPRTDRHGHTIHLNLKEPVRDPARYLLYHEVFARTRAQGAITGYAHLAFDEGARNGARAGLALDLPFGLVDFVEVLQLGTGNPKTWFDFLNLGYKLSPSAGTDYPYADIPGAVRNYVYMPAGFETQGWFEGLRQGQTFVTNGPMLEFTVNGRGMGCELQLKSGGALTIEASARLNPDIDRLDRLELIEQGKVIKTISSAAGAEELRLQQALPAKQGSWFVLRACGKQQRKFASILAMSAPIYIRVEGGEFWKPAAVPEIVKGLKKDMQEMLEADRSEIENWDTDEADARYWEAQKPLLKDRIDQATALYDERVRRAAGSCSEAKRQAHDTAACVNFTRALRAVMASQSQRVCHVRQ